ncbi:MAG: hypothetical protein AMJ61_13525 [Desulfobacterales bacterium SG8_35_2]|nr:MAG: hypothetical protein AMJ61_13525 [Desulfobacterales bacterium SG8_35_2]
MAVKRFFLYGFLALFVSGCGSGHSVTETLHIPDTPTAGNVCTTDKTVVLLPFADYSSGDDIISVYERSLSVSEALTDRFVDKGFKLPVQEDVTQYLVDAKIIRLPPQDRSAKLKNELDGEWSDVVKGEFEKWIEADRLQTAASGGGSANPDNAPGVHGLDKMSIAKLGRRFNADYIVRGRIIEYNLQKEHTWDLRKKGILPFIMTGTTQAAFGFAESKDYDNLNNIALWGLAGAIIGNNVGTPVSTGTGVLNAGDHPDAWNSVIWGLGGAGLAHLANHSGETPEALVQLRVWVQDSATGEVVWTNRAEVKVAPESVYGDKRSNELFKTAVNRATTLLVDDFWNKTKAIM